MISNEEEIFESKISGNMAATMLVKKAGIEGFTEKFENNSAKIVDFRMTPLISPYLYALIAGPYAYKEV